jgi:hypothetical protein
MRIFSVFERSSRAIAPVAALLTLFALAPPRAFAGLPSVAWDTTATTPPVATMSAPSGMAIDHAANVYVTADVLAGALTVKYDANGVEQWRVQEPTGLPVSLKLDDSGSVYLAAATAGPDPGTRAYLTIKYDTNGVKQWQVVADDVTGRDAIATEISVDPAGNVYTSGTSRSVTGGSWTFLSVKYDRNGIEQWRVVTDTFDAATSGYLLKQAVDQAGNLTVSGSVSGDCLTVSYGPGGNERWRAGCNDAISIWAVPTSITADRAGNIYVTARSAYLVSGGDTLEMLTIKYDVNGVEQWRARLPVGIELVDAFALAVDSGGNVYVTGRLWDDTINRSRPITAKYSSTGAHQWTTVGDYLLRFEDYAYGIALDQDGNVYVGGPSYDLSTGESNRFVIKYDNQGAEQWQITSPGAITAGSPFLLFVGPDEAIYTATQSDDQPQLGIAVQKLIESPTTLVGSPNPSIIGQSVTLTATVGNQAPPGSVVFREGELAVLGCFTTVPVISGSASCTTASMTPGTHSIAAIYDDNDGSITSWTYLTQVVVPPPTATSLSSSQNPASVGQPVTFTATVTGHANAPTGTLDFLDGAASVCAAVPIKTLAGKIGQGATCSSTLASGMHPISAVYSGDLNNAPSTSNTISQVVVGGNPTTTTLKSSLNPSHVGNLLTLTAMVTGLGGITGTVTFKDRTQAIAGCVSVALTASLASCSTNALGRGKHSITAAYSGDATNAASASAVLKQVVKR